jgi:hypothetical protein
MAEAKIARDDEKPAAGRLTPQGAPTRSQAGQSFLGNLLGQVGAPEHPGGKPVKGLEMVGKFL